MIHANIVLGVIGADCHAVGNKILEIFFSEKGYTVSNLGVMVSQKEFIDAAIETGSKIIMVSSLYGQGELDCKGLRQACIERGLEDVLLYVGGNLAIGKNDFQEIEKIYIEMGYNRVYPPDVDLEIVHQKLQEDLAVKVS